MRGTVWSLTSEATSGALMFVCMDASTASILRDQRRTTSPQHIIDVKAFVDCRYAGFLARNHALAFSMATGPDGRVVTFEPQSFMSKVNLQRSSCTVCHGRNCL